MITHYSSPITGDVLCGAALDEQNERSRDIGRVDCSVCLNMLDQGEHLKPPAPTTAAEAIDQVAELDGKPPTDDTAGDDTSEAASIHNGVSPAADAAARLAAAQLAAGMEPITSEVTGHDPAHHTERALRCSASWQVLCRTRLELNALATQTTFHGAYPLGEVTRLAQDLHKAMVKDAYAWGMHQRDMEWLVAGIDTTANYRTHFERTWGEDFARKLQKWWEDLYTEAHIAAQLDHAERVRLATYQPAPHGR